MTSAERRPEMRVERGQLADHPVVCEQASVLLEGVGVLDRQIAGRRETYVSDERPRHELVRLPGERLVVEGGDRLLADSGGSVAVKPPEPGAVGLPVALH